MTNAIAVMQEMQELLAKGSLTDDDVSALEVAVAGLPHEDRASFAEILESVRGLASGAPPPPFDEVAAAAEMARLDAELRQAAAELKQAEADLRGVQSASDGAPSDPDVARALNAADARVAGGDHGALASELRAIIEAGERAGIDGVSVLAMVKARLR